MKKLAVVAVLLFLSGLAMAKYISITTTMDSVMLDGNATRVNVSLRNSGDEAAMDTRLSLLLPQGFDANSIFVGTLGQAQFRGVFNITAKDALPGEYAFAVLTEYKDANGYPFSSVSPNTIVYKNMASAKLSALMEGIKLGEKGTAEVKVKLLNRDSKQHDVLVHLYLPNEISTRENEKALQLNQGEERSVSFEISNFGALVGSSYSVFVAISYEDGAHYSAAATGTIEIIKSESIFSSQYLIIVLVILVAAFIAYQFRGRFKRV